MRIVNNKYIWGYQPSPPKASKFKKILEIAGEFSFLIVLYLIVLFL